MKRVIALLLIISMVVSLSGCGVIGMVNAAEKPTEEVQEERTLKDDIDDLLITILSQYLANKVEDWIEANVNTDTPTETQAVPAQ